MRYRIGYLVHRSDDPMEVPLGPKGEADDGPLLHQEDLKFDEQIVQRIVDLNLDNLEGDPFRIEGA